MRVALADLSDFVQEPGFATVTIGNLTVKCQVDGDFIVLWPERSYKHRLLAKRIGLVAEE